MPASWRSRPPRHTPCWPTGFPHWPDGPCAGVIDVGDFGRADPALDLVCAWHLLDREGRQVFRDRLGVPDAQWERGRAWAFAQALCLPWYYERSNPAMARLGLRTLERVLAGERADA